MPYPFWISNLGRKGEYLARRYFHRHGFHLLNKNWTHGRGEIDLIMANSKKILFVEVKTRTKQKGRGISDVLSHDQERRLLQLGHAYLNHHGFYGIGWEFQLIYILHQAGRKFSYQTALLH